MFTGRDEKFRKALLDTVLHMNAEQVKAVKSYAIKYLLPALEEDVQPAADPAETLPEGSGLSEAEEEEIRRKAQEYADMLREEKRVEGRSSSLNDGRLKKEA